jgi:hypothetical protein
MAALAKRDRVRWQGEQFEVSSVWNTNTEGWRADLVCTWGGVVTRLTVPVAEVEKEEEHRAS